jgi:hypothetical protein
MDYAVPIQKWMDNLELRMNHGELNQKVRWVGVVCSVCIT